MTTEKVNRLHVKLSENNGRLKVKDLPKNVLAEIHQSCSFKIDGAEHSERFKAGMWDGYKRLFNKSTGIFPMGLWWRIQQILDKNNILYDILEEPQEVSSEFSLCTDNIEARDYQEKAKEKAVEAKRCILQVATGGGKTVIATLIMAELGIPTLFMVHTKDLLYQSKHSFEEILGVEIGQIGDGIIDIKPITVATIQTISRALGTSISYEEDTVKEKEIKLDKKTTNKITECLNNTKLVIWDEVHRIACDMAFNVNEAIKHAPYRIGLSASPWRDDNADIMIEASMGHVAYKISASDLIDRKYLVQPIIKMITIPTDYVLDNRTYDQVYKQDIVENEKRNNIIVDQVEKFMEMGIPTLILVKQIRHGKILQKLIKERFGDVQFLSGRDYTDIRVGTINDMREGKIDLLIASTIADEGLDIKRLSAVILAGGGKSSTRALQRVGRVLRPFEGKSMAYVVDFNDQSKYLKEHSEKRKRIYQTEEKFILLEL